jgi:hypothetical protein
MPARSVLVAEPASTAALARNARLLKGWLGTASGRDEVGPRIG